MGENTRPTFFNIQEFRENSMTIDVEGHILSQGVAEIQPLKGVLEKCSFKNTKEGLSFGFIWKQLEESQMELSHSLPFHDRRNNRRCI
jgi:hypothetical protein